jgi:uncharacterized protein (TIRG00374 family)
MRSAGGKILRGGVSLLLLAWILRRAWGPELAELLLGIPLWVLLAVVGLNVAMMVLQAVRWRLLLRAMRSPVPFSNLVEGYYVCTFFNAFLPTSVGGDVVRVLYATDAAGSRSVSLATALIERFLGFLVLIPMSLAGYALLRAPLPNGRLVLALEGVCVVALAAGAMVLDRNVMSRIVPRPLRALLERRLGGLLERLRRVYAEIARLRKMPGALLGAFAMSVLARAVWIAGGVLLGRALGLPLAPAHYFIIIPLVELVRTIPVSLNGMGVREWAFALLYAPLGATETQSVAFSLAVYTLLLLNSLAGGVLYAMHPPGHALTRLRSGMRAADAAPASGPEEAGRA